MNSDMDAEEYKGRTGGLKRLESESALRADLTHALADRFMMQVDEGAAFANAMASAEMNLPSPASIEMALGPVEELSSSRDEMERVLARDQFEDITIAGMKIDTLLGPKGDHQETRDMLRRGINFLKARKYALATEWWTLNRPPDREQNPRLHLLLTLLLVMTHSLAGDKQAAARELEQARSSHLFTLYHNR